MKILLNASTLVVGGALQACVSFIIQSLNNDDGIEWYYAVSKEISDEILKFGISIKEKSGTLISPSPAKSKKSRKEISQYIAGLNPDAVFTFFGPAYINIEKPHIMGVANGWSTHSTRVALTTKTMKEKLLFPASLLFRIFWYKKADRWVVEAACAQRGMEKRFFIKKKRVAIVPNNCADIYLANKDLPRKVNESIKILTLSSYYIHKNLEIIPLVSAELVKKSPSLKFEFIITLPDSKESQAIIRMAESLGVADKIRNIGRVAVVDGPDIYAHADIVFMPSLLETFSAVYPEAMISGCPIVTADLDFSRDICGEAALYYPPLDPVSAANQILKVADNPELFDEMIKKGRERFKTFPTQAEKYQLYIAEIKNLLLE